jgi:hypothetical protein
LLRKESFLVPKVELSGMWVVFYRAIDNRPAEIVGQMRLPASDDLKCIVDYWIHAVTPAEARFERMTEIIPEVQDLKSAAFACNDPEHAYAILKRMHSFRVHLAIYDRVNDEVLYLRYGEFPFMVKELQVDESRDAEVVNLIGNTYNGSRRNKSHV